MMFTVCRLLLGARASGQPDIASQWESMAPSLISTWLFRLLVLTSAAISPLSASAQHLQPSSGGDISLDEIVVTAQKRTEEVVNVPISINVVSSSGLHDAAITSVSDLAQVVPGIRIDESGPYSQPSIRGVSSVVAGPGFAANIATYVDGFYHPDPLGNDISFFDTDSVQVLKGPQGTLFGRNTTGGAFLLTTLSPSFTPAVEAQVSYGNYNETHESLFATAPINEVIAFSISGHYDRSDGFDHNIVTNQREGDMDGGAVHAKLLYAPNEDTAITLAIEHSHLNDPNGFLYSVYKGESDGPIYFPGTAVTSQRGQVANNDPDLYVNDTTAGYLTGKFNIGPVKLASYTGYQYIDVSALSFDLDATAAPFGALSFPEVDRIFTQEFDLSGTEGRIDWVTGLFYMHQRALQDYYITSTAAGSNDHISNTGQTINAYAGFADVTYKIADSLFLTAGGRYGVDQLSALTEFAPTFSPFTPHHTFDRVDGRVVLRYQFDPSSNVYASVNRGSKAGSFNSSSGDPQPVSPEHIMAYEVGYKVAKSTWSFETAAFDYEYKDMQVTEYIGNVANDVNAAAARIYGAEGDLTIKLTKELRINAGAAYTHGKYLSFDNGERYTFSPISGVITTPGSSASGNPTERTPKFSGDVAVIYQRELPDGTLNFTTSFAYQSKIDFDPFGDTYEDGYGLLNLRAAWTEPGDHWTVAVYGKNVTDKKYLLQVNQESAATSQVYGHPATYGLEVTYRH